MAALLAEPETLGAFLPGVDEALAREALRRASGAVRSYCGWNLLRETASITFDSTGWGSLWLPTQYLVSVDSVSIYGWGSIDPAYYTHNTSGRLAFSGMFRASAGPVTVGYTHGYDANSAQMDHIRGVVTGVAVRLVDNPSGRRSQTIGGESWTLATGPLDDPNATLSSGERTELDPYVMVRL